MENVLQVLTYKSVDTILQAGGSEAWALDRNRAMDCKYAVMCRNAHNRQVEGKEAHGSAFMIGKISDVVRSTENEARWRVVFSHYAVVNYGDQWEGRNPVRFYTTDDYDFNFEAEDWRPMPHQVPEAITKKGLTIAEAKAGLAESLGVPPSAIEILIRA